MIPLVFNLAGLKDLPELCLRTSISGGQSEQKTTLRNLLEQFSQRPLALIL